MAKKTRSSRTRKPAAPRKDRLSMDVSADMARIDDFMSNVLASPESWTEFKRDPNGAFVRGAVHPPTTPKINERVNQIFWATLANRDLSKFILDEFTGFDTKASEATVYEEGLRKGRIANESGLDLRAADHLLRRPDSLRKAFRLSLHDLNAKGLLERSYSTEEIDDYIDSLVDAVVERKPISNLPVLEEWDKNYGIGKHFGFGVAEVGPVATAAAAAEFGIAFTVYVAITASPSIETLFAEAFADGKEESAQALLTMSRLFAFASEMAIHARRFAS